MELGLKLGVVAGLVQVMAYIAYNWSLIKGDAAPITSTWTIWAFLSILNASSYTVMSGDIAKSILPISSAAATIYTFAYSMIARKFLVIQFWEWFVLASGIVAGVVWWWYQSATYANLIVAGAASMAFLPFYRWIWKHPENENPFPWYIWTSAYALNTLVVFLRWRDQYQDLVYPVSMFFLHLAAGSMTFRKFVINAGKCEADSNYQGNRN
jgi:hypothetical protein